MRSVLCILLATTTAAMIGCGTDSSTGGDDDDIPAGCGNASLDTGEQCDDGNDNDFDGCRKDCTMVETLTPSPMAWQYFEIAGTKCNDGTPAGFSVNYNPSSTKLAIYLEGGGACFNSFCDSLFTRGPNQPGTGGIFDRSKADNPLKDWTWVYIPYCSGDVYGGENEMMLAGKTRYFYGYSNITAFLQRIVPSFDVDQVLLTGSSAGGFGAAVNYAQTQRAYDTTPVALLDDSGPPMTGDVFPPCLQALWKTTWGLEKTMVKECGADCANSDTFISDTFAHVRKTFPNMRAALFSSTGDQTIRTFAGYGWSGGYNMCKDTPTAVSAQVYADGLEKLRTDNPDLGTFYVTGSSHTILRSGNFYTTKIGTMTLPQWTTDLIGGTTSSVGPQ
jgi:cysteine-rich repeat protein